VPDAAADVSIADAANPCAPDACLLMDDFSGPSLNASLWGSTVGGGATITQSGGALTIHLPAAADAFADVHSLIGFGVGTGFEATVTVTPGQFFDHIGLGFASDRINNQCDVGETDAAMFRGQDQDGYIETKAAGVYSCNKVSTMYPGASSKPRSRVHQPGRLPLNDAAPRRSRPTCPPACCRSGSASTTQAPTTPIDIKIDSRVSRTIQRAARAASAADRSDAATRGRLQTVGRCQPPPRSAGRSHAHARSRHDSARSHVPQVLTPRDTRDPAGPSR
jgi:hypothetical protein